MAGCCGYGNEPLGSIKFGDFLTAFGPVNYARRTLLHVVS